MSTSNRPPRAFVGARVPVRVAAAVIGVVLLAGCGFTGGLDGPEVEEVGSFVQNWSEASIDELATFDRPHAVIVDDQARDEWLAALPADEGLDPTSVLAVDLQDHVLVAGGYNACMEQSRVVFVPSEDGVGLAFDVFVAEEDQQTLCSWSPFQVDVWKVALADLANPDPADIELVPVPGE